MGENSRCRRQEEPATEEEIAVRMCHKPRFVLHYWHLFMARKITKARGGKSRSNTMWGGRYKLGPAEIMERINASIGFDKRLYAQDLSLIHI